MSNVEPSDQLIKDIMGIALGGGIDYWSSVKDVKRDEDGECVSYFVADEEDYCENGDETTWYYINVDSCRLAIRKLISNETNIDSSYPIQYLAAVNEDDSCNIDIELADMVIQVVAYNDVIFG